MDHGPIFIGGLERSGTSLIYALLASHPNIAMTRRTNLWTYFYNQYGDLGRRDNFERCLNAMLHYKRLVVLKPDPERLRQEFWQGEPTYGRLFALLEQQYADRVGKSRWGDKSLNTERYAEPIFAAMMPPAPAPSALGRTHRSGQNRFVPQKPSQVFGQVPRLNFSAQASGEKTLCRTASEL